MIKFIIHNNYNLMKSKKSDYMIQHPLSDVPSCFCGSGSFGAVVTVPSASFLMLYFAYNSALVFSFLAFLSASRLALASSYISFNGMLLICY